MLVVVNIKMQKEKVVEDLPEGLKKSILKNKKEYIGKVVGNFNGRMYLIKNITKGKIIARELKKEVLEFKKPAASFAAS